MVTKPRSIQGEGVPAAARLRWKWVLGGDRRGAEAQGWVQTGPLPGSGEDESATARAFWKAPEGCHQHAAGPRAAEGADPAGLQDLAGAQALVGQGGLGSLDGKAVWCCRAYPALPGPFPLKHALAS